jgi:hypothetical protein
MMTLQDVQSNVSQMLGIKPKSTLDKLRDLDLRGIDLSNLNLRGMINRRGMLTQRMDIDLDTTSMVVGLVIGMGVGFALGYMLKGNVRPAITTVRQRAEEALERVEDTLPSRLNISRLEETRR